MRINQLQTEAKNRVNLEELHALNSAYGQRLKQKEIIQLVGLPAVVLGVFSLILTYIWWIVVGCTVIGAIYGYRFILPKVVNRRYQMQSLMARNKFLLNLTQVTMDNDLTVLQSLAYVIDETEGELSEDLRSLYAALGVGSDPERVSYLLNNLSEKYHDDVIFGQYLEQLDTIIQEGKNNTDSLQYLTEHHSKMLEKVNLFLKKKNEMLSGVQTLLILMGAIILLFHGVSFFMNGDFAQYMDGYAHHPIGYVSSAICLISLSMILNSFFKQYFDDSVTELGVRTKK